MVKEIKDFKEQNFGVALPNLLKIPKILTKFAQLRALTLVSLRTLGSLRSLGTRAKIKAPICRQSGA